MGNESGFSVTFGQIGVRLAPLLLLGLVAFAEGAGGVRGDRPHEVGTKGIIYDSRAERIVVKSERVRVVSASLENGRGLVAIDCMRADADGLNCLPLEHFARTDEDAKKLQKASIRCDTELLVADAWEGLSAFCLERTTDAPPPSFLARAMRDVANVITGGPDKPDRLRAASVTALLPSTRQTCPESDCLDIEHAGVAIDDAGDITVAEPHKDRISTFRLGLRPPVRLRDAEVIGQVEYSGRAGMMLNDVARLPGGGLVVAESSSTDPKLSGVRLLMNKGSTGEDLVPGMYAPHPVGIWFSRDTQRLYVTDVSNGVQRWMYVEHANGKWSTPPRTFWTTADTGSKLPVLRHLITGWNDAAAAEESREIVFAGGPDGLYVMDPAGLLLAKYSLGRPLSGLDWGRSGELFFSAGRFLAVLRVSDKVHPVNGSTLASRPVLPRPDPLVTQPPDNNPLPQPIDTNPSVRVTTPVSFAKAQLNSPPVDKPPARKSFVRRVPIKRSPLKPTCVCR